MLKLALNSDAHRQVSGCRLTDDDQWRSIRKEITLKKPPAPPPATTVDVLHILAGLVDCIKSSFQALQSINPANVFTPPSGGSGGGENKIQASATQGVAKLLWLFLHPSQQLTVNLCLANASDSLLLPLPLFLLLPPPPPPSPRRI